VAVLDVKNQVETGLSDYNRRMHTISREAVPDVIYLNAGVAPINGGCSRGAIEPDVHILEAVKGRSWVRLRW
jgi:hypothetical protein